MVDRICSNANRQQQQQNSKKKRNLCKLIYAQCSSIAHIAHTVTWSSERERSHESIDIFVRTP